MQYSDTSTKLGIIQREEALCSLGDGGISGDATLLYQFTGYNNQALSEIAMAIKSVSPKTYDDLNYTDYPDAPITMVLNQADYTIPVASTGAKTNTNIGINGIYLEYGNERTYLKRMTDQDVMSETAGLPDKFKIEGQSIFFNRPFDAATLTQYSSLFYVEFSRSPSYFVSTDTTKEPGFLVTYHELIALKGSSIYLRPVDLVTSREYNNDFLMGLENLKRDIVLFDRTQSRRVTPAYHDNR